MVEFLVLAVLVDRFPSLCIVGAHPVTWLLYGYPGLCELEFEHMYINICGMHILPMCQVHVLVAKGELPVGTVNW